MSITPAMPDVQQQQLSDDTRTAIATLITGVLQEEKSARRAEVRKAGQQRNFRNGNQYLWWDNASNCYMQPEASGNELPRFMDVYNIYTPHWRSLVSILSQNPTGVNFVPEDLQVSLDVMGAASAEKMRHRFDRLVHMKDRQAEAAGHFCTDGRTVTHTYIDSKGKLRCTVHGVLESKVPIFARKMERWGYCVLSEEVDLWEAKENYPDFADDIKADADNSEMSYERYARLGILANKKGAAGNAEALKNLTTEHVAWIRPSRYAKASDDAKAELKALYPEGFRATMISNKVVDCIPEVMEDALMVEWPAPGQGSARPSLLHDLVPIQQAFNDNLNMLREHIDFSIPARWITDTVDSEAIAEQRAAPGVIHQITVPNGASINDLVMQEEVAQLPPELVANIDRLLSLAQFTTGDLPALFGDGTPDQETASGQKMLSDQAKGQLSPAWGGLQWLFAITYQIGVMRAAEMVADKPLIAVPGANGQQRFNPASILDGNWGCYPDTDSSFPETMADKRASLQAVLSQLGEGEQGQAIVFHPDNLKLIKQYSGLEDLIIPGAEARDKQLREIEQMLQEPPVPDQTKIPQWQQASQQAQLQGQPPPEIPLTTSVPVGKYDYNQAELDKCIEWLSSTACYEEMQKGNQQGVQNVTLHADAHAAAIQAQAPPPAIKPPNVTLTAQITDPVAISELLGIAGAQTTPENIEASNVPEEQNQAADTQLKAAGAQHKAVLAAKEAITPIQKPMTPEQQLEAKKTQAKDKAK